jgi:dethiobiotin synthetase
MPSILPIIPYTNKNKKNEIIKYDNIVIEKQYGIMQEIAEGKNQLSWVCKLTNNNTRTGSNL